jgi:hypothetical protein
MQARNDAPNLYRLLMMETNLTIYVFIFRLQMYYMSALYLCSEE